MFYTLHLSLWEAEVTEPGQRREGLHRFHSPWKLNLNRTHWKAKPKGNEHIMNSSLHLSADLQKRQNQAVVVQTVEGLWLKDLTDRGWGKQMSNPQPCHECLGKNL